MLPSGDPEGEGDTIEVLVENSTDERQRIAVLIEDESGDTLVSRVYDLESGHLDSSTGIDTAPATVTAFTPAGLSSTWQYAPDDEFECEGVDIGMTVTEDHSIEPWYGC